MPIPKPHSNEEKQEYISRCIETLENRDPDRSHDQIQAICYKQYRKSQRDGNYNPDNDNDLPPRGTGHKLGTSGPRKQGNPRTEEERKERHAKKKRKAVFGEIQEKTEAPDMLKDMSNKYHDRLEKLQDKKKKDIGE